MTGISWSDLPPPDSGMADARAAFDHSAATRAAIRRAFGLAIGCLDAQETARAIAKDGTIVEAVADLCDLVDGDEMTAIEFGFAAESDKWVESAYRRLAEGDVAGAMDDLREAMPDLRPPEAERRLVAARAAGAHLFRTTEPRETTT